MSQYDDPAFFAAYARMPRSQGGLGAAGEWRQLRQFFPPLKGKAVLDLGCGYGWHCHHAALEGAREVLGIDSSEKMIALARERHAHPVIRYEVGDIEGYAYPAARFDLVLTNLALHYVEDLDSVYARVFRTLIPGGSFLLNIEHPTFTACPGQTWIQDQDGRALHWPVDDYFYPGPRETLFLGEKVRKYHHTLTQILNGLLEAGFTLRRVEEAQPAEELRDLPGMRDEMRRPMMLLLRADKPAPAQPSIPTP